MPIPTFAFKIILTSFAPSPIDRHVFFGNRFWIILTISAFYFGETLQARTTSTLSEASKKILVNFAFWSIWVNAYPVIIIPCLLSSFYEISFVIFFKSYSNLSPASFILCSAIKLSRSPAAIAIYLAVPTLSPVSTHTLMPARLINLMVSGTSSWSLSSIAVAPSSVRPCSISASTASIFYSRSKSDNWASYFLIAHFW